jgi:hypothetical protein
MKSIEAWPYSLKCISWERWGWGLQLEAICSLVETGGRQRSRRRVDIPNRAVVSLPSGIQSWLAMGILSINGGFVGKIIILK